MKTKLLLLTSLILLISCASNEKIKIYNTKLKAKNISGLKKFNPTNHGAVSKLFSPIPITLKNRYEKLGRLVSTNKNIRESVSFINRNIWKDEFNSIDSINISFLKNYVKYNLNKFDLTQKEKDSLKVNLTILDDINEYRTYKAHLFSNRFSYLRNILFNKLLYRSYPIEFNLTEKSKKEIKNNLNIKASIEEILGSASDTLSIKLAKTITNTIIIDGKFHQVEFYPDYEDKIIELLQYKKYKSKLSFDEIINNLKKTKTTNKNTPQINLISSAIIFDMKINSSSIKRVLDTIQNNFKGKLTDKRNKELRANLDSYFSNDKSTNIKSKSDKIYLIKYGYSQRISELLN